MTREGQTAEGACESESESQKGAEVVSAYSLPCMADIADNWYLNMLSV